MQIVKMFGPSISDPSKIVNRDVPACDEQAYVRAGYKRGSVSEVPEVPVPEAPAKHLALGSEELPMEDPDLSDTPTVALDEAVAKPDQKQKNRKKKAEGV
jgi:hypothetical protein